MESKYQNINVILTKGTLNQENWVKISKALIINKKDKIQTEAVNKRRIIEGFKKLKKHSKMFKEQDMDVIGQSISFIMNTIQGILIIYKKEDKLFALHSK